MSKLGDTLGDFVSRFGVAYRLALVGGLAVSVRTEPRFTRDIDFSVAVSNDAEAEAMIYSAQQLGYLVETTLEQAGTKQLSTVRLRRGKEPIVDLLFAASGIEAEIAHAATVLEVLGHPVPVAAIGHLIPMKLLSRDAKTRPRDDDDLLGLARGADATEWARAAEAVELIETRGFARKRNLKSALTGLRTSIG